MTGVSVFCLNCRQLKLATVKVCYSLPRIDARIDALSESRWFSTFDLRSGYHQVAMKPRDAEKTAFITRNRTYCFQAMPFRLCNAPATFQRLMNVVLSGLNQDVLLVYLDDITIHFGDLPSLPRIIERFLERMRLANLKLKVSKCRMLQREVHFLGHVIFRTMVRTWIRPRSWRSRPCLNPRT